MSEALRPMITILVALGVLAFIAASIAAGQIIQRDQDVWRADNHTMRSLGMAPSQLALTLFAAPAVLAIVAIATALLLTTVASPLAPLGPLHEFDPGQGIVIDPVVAVAGTLGILVTIGAIGGLQLVRRSTGDPAPTRAPTFTVLASRPAAAAGIALGAGRGRHRARRLSGFATVAIALVALVGTLVVSAVALTGTRSRYGFDWDVLAVNPYGDQTAEGLQATFGDDSDVTAATGFTSAGLLIDGNAVPGLAATPVKGTLGPTTLEGRQLRDADEIVLGSDTLDRLGVAIGDRVEVRAPSSTGGESRRSAEPLTLRVVGIATFPPVVQLGTDQPRLGTGALVGRAALDHMLGRDDNDPEWTAARLAPGVEAAALIARTPDGVPDRAGFPTTWYTDAKPAELRQLDAVRSLLLAAVAISVLIAIAVIGYGMWTQTRANRHDLATLAAIGFTRRQLSESAAWQVVPLAVIATGVGVPVGIALGRWGFAWFGRSLAVVDRVVIPGRLVAALIGCAIVVCGIGAMLAAAVARRTHTTLVLREQ